MRYELAGDIQKAMHDIVEKLGMNHVMLSNVVCIRSHGTSSKRIIARCHGLGKVMQLALQRKGFYVLEFISERYDKLSREDQIKTIIHELMHIPKCFGGGFRHHDFVTEKNVKKLYSKFLEGEKNEKKSGQAQAKEKSEQGPHKSWW